MKGILALFLVGGALYFVKKNGVMYKADDWENSFNKARAVSWADVFPQNSASLAGSSLSVGGSDLGLPKKAGIVETFKSVLSSVGVKLPSDLPVIGTFKDAVKQTFNDSEGQLLDRIAEGEGTSDSEARRHGYSSGYDVTLGYGAYVDDKLIRLSTMTLDQVDALQSKMLRNPKNKWNSSAAGKYQIVRTTLRKLKKLMGLSGGAIYSPSLQDRMAIYLLNGRGYKKFKSGAMSARDFQYKLSQEWASIANPRTGKALQHTGTTTAQIQAVLKNFA